MRLPWPSLWQVVKMLKMLSRLKQIFMKVLKNYAI
jgi:hypothetical protein